MNEKNSLQYITEAVAQSTGESKKVAEQFAKAFFDTIVEALYMGETQVKVKGLGTFKLIDVDSRESVNVANGERIIIPSYKKVSFVPDDDITDRLSIEPTVEEEKAEAKEEPTPVVVDAPVEVEKPVAAAPQNEVEDDAATEVDNLITPDEPVKIEQPCNELGGIDLLISTPESIAEIQAQYAEACKKATEAIAAAKQANTERVRLERMLERLEANAAPEADAPAAEAVVEDSNEEQEVVEVVEETPQVATAFVSEPVVEDNDDDVASNEPEPQENNEEDYYDDEDEDDDDLEWQRMRRNRRRAALAVAVLILGFIIYHIGSKYSIVEYVVEAEEVETPMPYDDSEDEVIQEEVLDTIPVSRTAVETVIVKIEKDTAKASIEPVRQPEPAKVEEPKKRSTPKYHVLQKGETLLMISRRYYHTDDSLRAIIRLNRFQNPNCVPLGAKVYLP